MPLNRLTAISAAAAIATVLSGCAHTGDIGPGDLKPRSLSQAQRPALAGVSQAGRPTVALVLGGGGLRGFAHIGVIRAMEEAGIQPDIVVGTSAGAVVGAAYASGMTSGQIETTARNIKLSSLIDLTWAPGGFMRGNNLAKWVDTVTASVPIEQFPVRFAAVATDMGSETPVLIDSGAAGRAIQASAAVPGATVPVPYEHGHLIDGGVTSLVPVRAARAMGADVVIAVDIYCKGPRSDGMSVPGVVSRVMRTQSCLLAAPEMAEADVLIAPAVSVSGMSAKDEQDLAVLAGYEAARAALARFMADPARTEAQARMRSLSPAPDRRVASGRVSRP